MDVFVTQDIQCGHMITYQDFLETLTQFLKTIMLGAPAVAGRLLS